MDRPKESTNRLHAGIAPTVLLAMFLGVLFGGIWWALCRAGEGTQLGLDTSRVEQLEPMDTDMRRALTDPAERKLESPWGESTVQGPTSGVADTATLETQWTGQPEFRVSGEPLAIRGRVIDLEGRGVEGVEVLMTTIDGKLRRRSEANGHFRFEPRRFEAIPILTVDSDDYACLRHGRPDWDFPEQELQLVVAPPTSVYVDVFDEFGDPVPKAEVTLEFLGFEEIEAFLGSEPSRPSEPTGPRGRASFEHVPRTPRVLARCRIHGKETRAEAAWVEGLVLELHREAESLATHWDLHGVVLDGTKKASPELGSTGVGRERPGPGRAATSS